MLNHPTYMILFEGRVRHGSALVNACYPSAIRMQQVRVEPAL